MTVAPIYCPPPAYRTHAELAMLKRVREESSALVARYIACNTHQGVVYVARDKAKELFSEYLLNPVINNRNADGPASAIADAVRRTVLSTPARRPKDNLLIVTGCPASGKTVSIHPNSGARIEIEHETIFTSMTRAKALIEQALSAGRFPIVRLFYTDDPRINVRRMIARARLFGRTVPISYMARTYIGVPQIVEALHMEFGAHLIVRVVNNSERPEQAVAHNSIARAIYHVSRYTEHAVLEAMRAEIDEISSRTPVPADILTEALS